MKSPRRIELPADSIARHNLSVAPPPQGSLFWTLWNNNSAIAQQAMETPFIQGIGAGTLDPVAYGGFNVNDAYYCFCGAPDYLAAANRTSDPVVKAFLLHKYNSYQTYNATFPSIWHVNSTASIVPFGVCAEYAGWEASIAGDQTLDPIYILIAMLPCDYLWAWLAAQLAQLSPTPGNLYAPWITDNNSPNGAYGIGNFLVSYSGEIDPIYANTIYQTAMNYELQNFLAGDPPPPVKGA